MKLKDLAAKADKKPTSSENKMLYTHFLPGKMYSKAYCGTKALYTTEPPSGYAPGTIYSEEVDCLDCLKILGY